MERISNNNSEEMYINPLSQMRNAGIINFNQHNMLSPEGNPAPNRGIIPIENMYDFQTARYFPETPYFVRGNVDVLLPIRNLALQAFTQAGGSVN